MVSKIILKEKQTKNKQVLVLVKFLFLSLYWWFCGVLVLEFISSAAWMMSIIVFCLYWLTKSGEMSVVWFLTLRFQRHIWCRSALWWPCGRNPPRQRADHSSSVSPRPDAQSLPCTSLRWTFHIWIKQNNILHEAALQEAVILMKKLQCFVFRIRSRNT